MKSNQTDTRNNNDNEIKKYLMTGYDDKVSNKIHKVKKRGGRHLQKEVKIGTVGKGQIIGYNDVINNTEHTTSVRCVSGTGVLY